MNLNADTYTSPEVSWEKLYYSFSQVLCNGKSSKKAFPITQYLGKAIIWQYGSKNKTKTWLGRKKTLREKVQLVQAKSTSFVGTSYDIFVTLQACLIDLYIIFIFCLRDFSRR